MKGVKGYDESKKSENTSLGFYELFGMKSSYVDTQVAAKLVRGLIKNIRPHYNDGAISELAIEGVTQGQDEELETLLGQMKIYPWIEEAEDGTFTFSIENSREVKRLSFFISFEDLGMTLVSEVAPMESGEDPKANESVTDPYAFPLPIVPVEGNPKVINPPRQRVDRAVYMGEVPEVDVWMQTASDNFDQGLPIEPEEEAEKFYRRGPDLSLFKNRYRFYKDAIKAPDGQLLSWEEHKEILLGAKDDPKKMEQAVNMSVGLVKMVVDRVIKKFGTNEIFDEDDLFQSGMEGLLHGLRRIEGRDDSKPASYLVPCIEGSLRTFIRTHKHVFTLPQHVADMVARYRRAQAELEKKIPRFHSLTLEEQEQQITKKAGLSDKEARAVLVTINAKKEPFSEEKIDPEPYEQTDPNRRIELEQLRHDISEILPGLSIREDLVLRLRFGILGESRFSDKNIIEEFIQESKVAAESMMERGSFESLYNFDLAQDDFDSYNPAEQLFLALIGKIPESWVEYIQNGSDDFSATTFENVGAILGVTRERIRQIEIKALRLLKRPSRSRITRAHLD